MRNTRQKELVLSIINSSINHLTSEEIYQECRKSIPNISLGTVYRNLNTLVEVGNIKKIKMPNNIDRYDKLDEHAHFICRKCNKIEDVYGDFIKDVSLINNGLINYHIVKFYGICKECLGKGEK